MLRSLPIVVGCRSTVLLKSELAGSYIQQNVYIRPIKPKSGYLKTYERSSVFLCFLGLSHRVCLKTEELLLQQVDSFESPPWIQAKQITSILHRRRVRFSHDFITTSEAYRTTVCVYMSSQTSRLSYLLMPARDLMLLAKAAPS